MGVDESKEAKHRSMILTLNRMEQISETIAHQVYKLANMFELSDRKPAIESEVLDLALELKLTLGAKLMSKVYAIEKLSKVNQYLIILKPEYINYIDGQNGKVFNLEAFGVYESAKNWVKQSQTK